MTLLVRDAFFAPALNLIPSLKAFRDCPRLPDAAWIHFGIDRVLQELPSGRAYLQQHGYRLDHCPPVSNYFESLKSERRLGLVGELNERLIQTLSPSFADLLDIYPELAEFDLHAGDGHWHGAAAHDAPIDGKKWAVGHFYALDLRTHALRYLDLAQGEKEHDMHVLKRQTIDKLRLRAPKGRKVLYVWDKAGIDFRAWYNWKKAGGLYFISLEKANMALDVVGKPEWDRHDPVNAGIVNVELVAGCAGVLIRRISYLEPISGEILNFITSEMTLRPGLIAFLYKMRWDIEKVFDQIKNKVGEQKAWASAPTAKSIQGNFICLTHNLLLGVETRLTNEGIKNEAELERKAKELAISVKIATAAGRKMPSPVLALVRFTQRSVKLLRWLRSSLLDRSAWDAATPRLIVLYATL